MNESEPGDSLITHLLELRTRLLRAVWALLIVFVALLPFSDRLYDWLAAPILPVFPTGHGLIIAKVTGGFTVPFKLTFFAALAITMPFILYQIWAFVAPGLYKNEKRLARPLLVSATLLFYVGVAFSYFLLLPVMLAYFGSTVPSTATYMPDIGDYLDFALVIFVGGGVAFEVPVAVMIAVILGWVTPAQLAEWRGYVIVAIFVIAAIITPPDGLSQIMLALPMCVLYELGLIVARAVAKPRAVANS